MAEFMHQCECLLRFPLFLDHNNWTVGVVQTKAKDRILFRYLPLAAIAITPKYQNATIFNRGSVRIEIILFSESKPLAGNQRSSLRLLSRDVRRNVPRS